ncbi:NTP transferase domain-containing protein [candidate division KSB1 bacterium]|nr:NTP transferase domain-containing protein [candidate division KSB1 bacterium]
MQAVILAAGKSTRTYPLTLTKPKPLLKAANKTILEYNLEAIKDIADEIIIVVGYKKDMIKNFISKNYPDLNVKYVEQKDQLGTGHAVSILEDQIKGKFLLIFGDNIYSKKDIEEIQQLPELSEADKKEIEKRRVYTSYRFQ